jgi:hypothetical protein
MRQFYSITKGALARILTGNWVELRHEEPSIDRYACSCDPTTSFLAQEGNGICYLGRLGHSRAHRGGVECWLKLLQEIGPCVLEPLSICRPWFDCVHCTAMRPSQFPDSNVRRPADAIDWGTHNAQHRVNDSIIDLVPL